MIKKLMIIFLAVLPISSHAKIMLDRQHKVSTQTDIESWIYQIKQNAQHRIKSGQQDADGYTECRESLDLSGVYLCGSYLQRDMNAQLIRATIFSDGVKEYPHGSLVDINNKYVEISKDIFKGHDLPSNELLAFYKGITEKCHQGKKAFCLNTKERSFYDHIVFPIKKTNEPFVIIAFAVQALGPPEYTISHELLHAKYFRNSEYRNKINLFWHKHLTASEHLEIEHALQVIGYNTENKSTLLNEFQAYTLQSGAEKNRSLNFAARYQDKLRAFLS